MSQIHTIPLSKIALWLNLPIVKTDREVSVLLTDSRSLTDAETTLFFALNSLSNDGHRYVESLYEKGVRMFVVEHQESGWQELKDAIFLQVKDSISALQLIATQYRQQFEGHVTAITGSRGKTTLKEWIFQLAEPLCKIERSPRSYNSQIGVPLSLWSASREANEIIIEAGISKKGEMTSLEEMIQPETIIITNIGDAHAEGFCNNKEKAKEKLILTTGRKAKLLIYSLNSETLKTAVAELRETNPGLKYFTWLWIGNSSDELDKATADLTIRCGNKPYPSLIAEYQKNAEEIKIPSNSKIDIENASNAIAWMLSRGISLKKISTRFNELHSIGTRLNLADGISGCSVVHDSYTSDFSSLPPALDFIRRRATESQKPVVILSDLRQEGISETELYKEVAQALKYAGVKRVFGIGSKISSNRECFPKGAKFYNSTDEFFQEISSSDFSNEIILIKGSPEFGFEKISEMLEVRTHETVLEVNLDALVRNYNYFRSNVPPTTGIICMVKAGGYGAGSIEIAKTLQDCGAAYLAVAVLDEGIELRRRGVTMPIMVMNPRVENYRAMFENKLEPEIYSFDMLEDMLREAQKCNVNSYPVHIKLDTGMHRMGFIEAELPSLMELLNSSSNIRMASVFSHLATADIPEMDDYTEMQLSIFSRLTDYMRKNYNQPFLRHILNSAGILRFPAHHYELVRLGIGLYGANTLPPEIEQPLSTVSTLRTIIIALRNWPAGTTIGYGRRGKLTRESKIATLPIGYADGLSRRFGEGKISVMINGHWAPIVGSICMDACMVDVTGIECQVGDSVEIFGANASLQRMADALGTIPYEILTSISPRVKRIYYRE